MKNLLYSAVTFVLVGLSPVVMADIVNGQVQWNQRVELGSGITGRVTAVHVKAGDLVASGDLLAEIDRQLLEIRFSKAASTERRYAAELFDRQAEFDRNEILFEEGSIAAMEFQRSQLELTRIETAHAIASADLRKAKYQLTLATILAPFHAWVVETPVDPGEFVVADEPDRPLVVLAQSGIYVARIVVPLVLAERLRPATDVTVLVGDTPYPGQVSTIALEPVDSAAAMPEYPVRVTFQTDRLIRSGTHCRVQLP